MIDREKVMAGLELCASTDCIGCPYQRRFPCQNKLAEDALALLKEQEARVLSKSEVMQYVSIASNGFQAAEIDEPPLWTEYKNRQKYGLKWVTFGMVYSWMKDYEMSLDYGKEFRFWTSRPTTEQMRDTPWEVTENG